MIVCLLLFLIPVLIDVCLVDFHLFVLEFEELLILCFGCIKKSAVLLLEIVYLKLQFLLDFLPRVSLEIVEFLVLIGLILRGDWKV